LLTVGAFPASKEVENEDDCGGDFYRAQHIPLLATPAFSRVSHMNQRNPGAREHESANLRRGIRSLVRDTGKMPMLL